MFLFPALTYFSLYGIIDNKRGVSNLNELTELQIKLLKGIKKHHNGISTELLLKKNNADSGIEYALDLLKKENYLERLISQDDKINKVFGLKDKDFTGDWIITDKGKAYLTNKTIEFDKKLIMNVISFVMGIVSTLLIQLLTKIISKTF